MQQASHLRANKPSERRTLFTRSEYIPDPPPPLVQERAPSIDITRASPRRHSRLRSSIVSMHAPTILPQQEPERAASPPVQPMNARHHRFSMLRFRHASDSQLAKTAARQQAAADVPPMPSFAPPSIITTAPTTDNLDVAEKRKSTFSFPRRLKTSDPSQPMFKKPPWTPHPRASMDHGERGTGSRISESNINPSRVTFDASETRSKSHHPPPAYGDESNSALALPITRLSESSRSDGSVGDHGVFAQTTTTHTVSTTTTFFRLARRKKDKGPLFPLPQRPDPPSPITTTPRASLGGRPSDSPTRYGMSPFDTGGVPFGSPLKNSLPNADTTLVGSSMEPAAPGGSRLFRTTSSLSRRSDRSMTSPNPHRLSYRGRSSTMGSSRLPHEEELPHVPLDSSTRTSSSAGRPSLGGLFALSRLRHSSEPNVPRTPGGVPGTPRSTRSNQNSVTIPREPPIVVPQRQEGDTPAKYLARLEEVVSRGAVVALLSKSDDDFSKSVLRSYMRRFKFFEDPIDMAVRKTLMQVELPKETQQIDRTLQSFADRYHECNPGIFASPDEAYFIAFSVLILHTDVFNKNNKHKMQKVDYTKNTRGQSVAVDVLECFYDNIAYTPFIHLEDEMEINGEALIAHKTKKGGFKPPGQSTLRKASNDPIDPYALILDNNLGVLRPDLKDIFSIKDPFNYVAREGDESLNVADLHRTFFRSGVIQIVSSRSRPDAFRTAAYISNPLDAPAGVVDMKITKVGILWRKDQKKKKTRSPWQEWGAILTGSQLYFFKNTGWIKSLIHQHDHHHKHGRSNTPVVFKPPLETFKPDFLLSTEDTVALQDLSYRKHKNAFVVVRQHTFQEVFLADNDSELCDWMAKLNYAAAFRTAGVRMRGVVGGSYESLSRHESEQQDAAAPAESSVNGPSGEVSIKSGKLNDELTQQIMVARRQILGQKITEANESLATFTKALDLQERNARHISILAPVLPKTRENIVASATRLATGIRWTRMELWRVRCHRDILAMDLAEDIKISSGTNTLDLTSQASASTQQTNPSENKTRAVFGRLNSRSSGASRHHSPSRSRPPTQPSGNKVFGMEDIFRAPSKVRGHKAQGSWELPPLSFEPGSSPPKDRYKTVPIDEHADEHQPTAATPQFDRSLTRSHQSSDYASIASQLAGPSEAFPDDEHIFLDAGLVPPELIIAESRHNSVPIVDGPNEIELADVVADDPSTTNNTLTPLKEPKESSHPSPSESMSKVRHSLQRKLQHSQHVLPHPHHGSRKVTPNNASSSTAGPTEDAPVADNEGEGLPRSTGSFTVHGKKASVVVLGADWSQKEGEERLNRLSGTVVKEASDGTGEEGEGAEIEDGKVANGLAVARNGENGLAVGERDHRPSSAVSSKSGTTTVKSAREVGDVEGEQARGSVAMSEQGESLAVGA